jgi:hypothetical protein
VEAKKMIGLLIVVGMIGLAFAAQIWGADSRQGFTQLERPVLRTR